METNIIKDETSASKATRKIPMTISSCDTARVVSRKLSRGGFEMSKKIDAWNRSNGFYVKRLGCSKTVFIDYWNPLWMRSPASGFAASELKYNKEQLQRAIEFLKAAGYQIDDKGYIQCERSY